MIQKADYYDDYVTCKRTYATLRIYPGEIHPDEITRELGIQPTLAELKGHIRPHFKVATPRNRWFLSSEKFVKSKDSRRHIDWILERALPAKDGLFALRERGMEMVVSCYWLSKDGHDGPTLSPRQMKGLVELDLDCWIDFYSF